MKLNQILFLDIETVSQHIDYDSQDDRIRTLWDKKSIKKFKISGEKDQYYSPAEAYEKRAAIFAEFGKVVCISVGYLKGKENPKLRIKSFKSHDEAEVLDGFVNLLSSHFNNPTKHFLCGHNIKEFDIPYICRRLLINGMKLPKMLSIMGKKPWQTTHLLDTLEMWKFGDYKHYTSLNLLTAIFHIPSPKGDIDGSEVGNVYWKENDLTRIADYCERDVVAVAQLYLRMTGNDLIEEENIEQIKIRNDEEE